MAYLPVLADAARSSRARACAKSCYRPGARGRRPLSRRGAAARRRSWTSSWRPKRPGSREGLTGSSRGRRATNGSAASWSRSTATPSTPTKIVAVLFAFFVGLVDLAAEMAVLRAGRFGLGASPQSTAILLSLALAGFGVGAALSRRYQGARAFAAWRVAAGIFGSVGALATLAAASVPGIVAAWVAPALSLVSAAAFSIPSGASIPLLFAWTRGLAVRAAILFAANAIGSIVGVVLGESSGPSMRGPGSARSRSSPLTWRSHCWHSCGRRHSRSGGGRRPRHLIRRRARASRARHRVLGRGGHDRLRGALRPDRPLLPRRAIGRPGDGPRLRALRPRGGRSDVWIVAEAFPRGIDPWCCDRGHRVLRPGRIVWFGAVHARSLDLGAHDSRTVARRALPPRRSAVRAALRIRGILRRSPSTSLAAAAATARRR